MTKPVKHPRLPPLGVVLEGSVERRNDGRENDYKARIRWTDPTTEKRLSITHDTATETEALAWIEEKKDYVRQGVDATVAQMSLAQYGEANMTTILRGLQPKTLDPYLAGWRKRIVPTTGHLTVAAHTHGLLDRVTHGWITDGAGQSTIKNTLAMYIRVLQMGVRDDLLTTNPAKGVEWQHAFKLSEDELADPRQLAIRDFDALVGLANALVAASYDRYPGWGEVVQFSACTACRIGEASGVQARDIDPHKWLWTVRRQTTPGPGGLADKATKGRKARVVPIIEQIRPLVANRLARAKSPESRLFTGPKGGRIATAVLRDATHWDTVVMKLGFEFLRRHDLRHTGLTWMADAGIPLHILQLIAGHAHSSTTEGYLQPSRERFMLAGMQLTSHLGASWPPDGPQILKAITSVTM